MQYPSRNLANQALKLFGLVRNKIRFKHYSIRIGQTYTDWINRFILYFGKRHPINKISFYSFDSGLLMQ